MSENDYKYFPHTCIFCEYANYYDDIPSLQRFWWCQHPNRKLSSEQRKITPDSTCDKFELREHLKKYEGE